MPHNKASLRRGPYHVICGARSSEDLPAEEVVRTLVGKEHIYAFGERTPHRKDIEPGDWICFYATGRGIVAHARVASKPEKQEHPALPEWLSYPWVFHLSDVKVYTERPVILDAHLRSKLDAFKARPPRQRWVWFVQRTRLVTEHDFRILTRQ